ncbi:hypothetical protein [Nonomuraea salmonea]|uniref:Uncharacterized protein n=1 Tax=Nonomuraea salmonea TaxID=46181 RepID=A0ABV5P2V8_9ACTN
MRTLAATTTQTTVHLPAADWQLIIDAIATAAADGADWCWCESLTEAGVCDCVEDHAAAHEYREVADELERKVKGRRGRVAVTYSASTWHLIAVAAAKGAADNAATVGFDCTQAGRPTCADCTAQRQITDQQAQLARRAARAARAAYVATSRAPRAPRGTRPRYAR